MKGTPQNKAPDICWFWFTTLFYTHCLIAITYNPIFPQNTFGSELILKSFYLFLKH